MGSYHMVMMNLKSWCHDIMMGMIMNMLYVFMLMLSRIKSNSDLFDHHEESENIDDDDKHDDHEYAVDHTDVDDDKEEE